MWYIERATGSKGRHGHVMGAGSIIKMAMTTAGIVIMLCSFWFLSVKMMTADFAVIWEIIGMILIIIGRVSGLSVWLAELYEGEELLMVSIEILIIVFFYGFSLIISRLIMRSHELAIEVSMLQQLCGKMNCGTEKDLLIILPVRNEEKNIGQVLEQLSQPEIQAVADILCINDASSDTSGQIIDRYPCTQIRNVFKLGYGSALKLGYKYAVLKNYKYVIQMDGDGQHDPCSIPVIYQRLQETGADSELPDIVLASRFMKDSVDFPVSIFKKIAFVLFRFMIRVITGRKIVDPTTGFQGLSRRAFTYYSQYNHFDYQYPDANIIVQMLLQHFRVTEVPAVMHVRTDGQNMHSGLEPVWYMLRMFLSVLTVVFDVKVLKKGKVV